MNFKAANAGLILDGKKDLECRNEPLKAIPPGGVRVAINVTKSPLDSFQRVEYEKRGWGKDALTERETPPHSHIVGSVWIQPMGAYRDYVQKHQEARWAIPGIADEKRNNGEPVDGKDKCNWVFSVSAPRKFPEPLANKGVLAKVSRLSDSMQAKVTEQEKKSKVGTWSEHEG